MRLVNRQHIQYSRSQISGLYYQANGTYYKNDNCRGGKLILMIPAGIQHARRQENEV